MKTVEVADAGYAATVVVVVVVAVVVVVVVVDDDVVVVVVAGAEDAGVSAAKRTGHAEVDLWNDGAR